MSIRSVVLFNKRVSVERELKFLSHRNRKLGAALCLSLIALVARTPAAQSQQVLMESDRPLAYPYRWDGIRPRGESECAQAAGQALIKEINQMANISAFSSFTGSDITTSLSNEFESIGDLIRNTTTFENGQSTSAINAAAQRGLVVGIFPSGFVPGTFGSVTENHWLTQERNSSCWGQLSYEFVVYGPETITRRNEESIQVGETSAGDGITTPNYILQTTGQPDVAIFESNGESFALGCSEIRDVWGGVPSRRVSAEEFRQALNIHPVVADLRCDGSIEAIKLSDEAPVLLLIPHRDGHTYRHYIDSASFINALGSGSIIDQDGPTFRSAHPRRGNDLKAFL